MNAAIIGQLTTSEAFGLVAHWLTLWLGLSLLTRRPRSSASALAGAAFLAISAYLLSVVFLLTSRMASADVFWDRWLGNWEFLAPVLLLHAFLSLTGTRLPHQGLLLALLYAAATAVVAMSMWGNLFFEYVVPPGAGPDTKGVFVATPLQFLQVLQAFGTYALAIGVLVFARRSAPAPARSQLTQMIVGSVLAILGSALMLANVYVNPLPFESLVLPLPVVGAFLVAVPFVRYRGIVEGQLLRSDLRASLLASALLMGLCLLAATMLGASAEQIARLGWVALAIFLLGDELRGFADGAFLGAGQRAGRAGLRTTASYAGASEAPDMAIISPGQSAELVEYLGALDRAGVAAARLEGPRAWRLELLARGEFAPVRDALGLVPTWRPEDGLSVEDVSRRVAQCLEPRERQVLGLKYLGYSDKEMALLIGVKANVPRAYLGAAKRKLGLPAGAPLMLFVHLAGLVESDTLPVLEVSAPAAAAQGATRTACEDTG